MNTTLADISVRLQRQCLPTVLCSSSHLFVKGGSSECGTGATAITRAADDDGDDDEERRDERENQRVK